jgi:hypothetical protein
MLQRRTLSGVRRLFTKRRIHRRGAQDAEEDRDKKKQNAVDPQISQIYTDLKESREGGFFNL